MLKIGKSYIIRAGGRSRLCADTELDGQIQTLWFEVYGPLEEYLVMGRADPFVMAMLPTAMRGGHEIICEDAMSERLHYQLCDYLIPALSFAGNLYSKIHITAPLTAEPYPNQNGIGANFPGDVNTLYTISRHGPGSECPFTHVTVFNTGAFKTSECRKNYFRICQEAARFADRHGLKSAFVDTNLYESLRESLTEVASFRTIACVLALQGLFASYLLPAADAEEFEIDVHTCASFDLLTAACAATESLTVYPDGAEAGFAKKLAALAEWKPYLPPPAPSEDEVFDNEPAKPAVIRIGVPRIERNGDAVRLCADVELFGKKEVMWFSVDEKYGEYLVDDRADAFVVGLLTPAMREGADIVCDAPVTRRLLYQLRQYLIPMLAANLDGFHSIALQAGPTDVKLPCENAVATGWTGGVDSMFTVMRHLETEQFSRRLTHLMITSNGSLEEEDNSAMLKKLVEKAENGIASELGLPVVGIDTNIQDIVDEVFITVVTYRHAAVILALQKLFGTYYNSSSNAFSTFSFDALCCSCYELVLLDCFETDNTSFYSSGGPYLRIQKLQELSNYPLAHRYLHPCIQPLPERNCNRCKKCVKAMEVLYSLDVLNRFSSVFDVDAFERDYVARQTEKNLLTPREKCLIDLMYGGEMTDKAFHTVIDGLDFNTTNQYYLLMLSALGFTKGWERFPPEMIPRLKGIHRYHQAHISMGTPWFIRQIRTLTDKGIPVMLLKGMAMRAYYAPGRPRLMFDYDFAVPEDRFNQALELLSENGNTLRWKSMHLASLKGSVDEINLHRWVFECANERASGIWERAELFRFHGVDVYVPAREDMLIHLLDTQSRDHFRRRGSARRMQWFYDCRDIWAYSGEPELERLAARAQELHVTARVRMMLMLFTQCFPELIRLEELERYFPQTPEYDRLLEEFKADE